MDKLTRIIQSPSFAVIVSVVVVYTLFLSAVLQFSNHLSLQTRSETKTSSDQVLGETSSPQTIQPPSGLLARNFRCAAGGTVSVDLFWQLDPQSYGYWIALYDFVKGWETKWTWVKNPIGDGLVSLTWQNLKPNSVYYWTIIAWDKTAFSPWAPIQYFQTVNCQ